MSFGNARLDAACDRFITGNYGEDQFRGQEEWETFVERTCSDCPCENWCPACKKFYDGDDDLYDNPCIVLKSVMDTNSEIDSRMSEEMERHYEQMVMEDRIEEAGTYVSEDPCENWENDHIQFARLIAECEAVGAIIITQELCDSMGLESNQIKEVINRAQYAFEIMKKQLPSNDHKTLFGDMKVEGLLEQKLQEAIDKDTSDW